MNDFYTQLSGVKDAHVVLEEDTNTQLIKSKYGACSKCKLKNDSKGFGYGEDQPLVAFIGYAPSAYEINLGKIFSDVSHRKAHGFVKYMNKKMLRLAVMYTTPICYFALLVLQQLMLRLKNVPIDCYLS